MGAYIPQGQLNVSVGYKIQNTWGFAEALVFFVEGIGVTIFSFFLLLNRPGGMLLGIAIMVMAVLLLFSHLGHPEKAYKAFTCIRTSWISRGTVVMTAFLILGIVHLGLTHFAGLQAGAFWNVLIKVVVLFLGLSILAYPGFALAHSPSIPFWNSGLLPVSFILNGLTSGLSWVVVFLAVTGVLSAGSSSINFVWFQTILLGLLLVSTIAYVVVMKSSVAAAKESAQRLMKGKVALLFVVVGCVIGLALPIILTALIGANAMGMVALSLIAAIAKTIGDLSLRYSFMKVGMYDPVF